MSNILKNVIQFTGLVAGVPVSQPHLLNVNGVPELPQLVAANTAGFVVTADDVNVTVVRSDDADTDTVGIYVEHWHTIETLLPPPGFDLAGKVPFYINGDGSSGSALAPQAWVTFRPGDPLGNRDNTYVDWPSAYAACRELAREGVVQLMLAFEFSPMSIFIAPVGGNAQTLRTFQLPPGVWDMRSVWIDSNTPSDCLTFSEGAFLEHLEYFGGRSLVIINNTMYTTPIIVGGVSPYGGTRPGTGTTGIRVDILNTVVGCKPLIKQGNGMFISQNGTPLTTLGSKPYTGIASVPSPVVDLAGHNYTNIGCNFENNAFTALAGALFTGASTTLTQPAIPGDMVLHVVTTSPAGFPFPPSGTINLNNPNYGEPLVYTSITPTTFVLATPVVGGYPGPGSSTPGTGSPVTTDFAVRAGDTTINVDTTASFPAIPGGAFRINGNLEVITYTGTTGTTFTGCANAAGGPVQGNYSIGLLIEPVRAVCSAAIPVAVGQTIPVDTTIGFPAAGNLYLYQNGVAEIVTYTSKTANSFVGVTTTHSYGTGAVVEMTSSFRGSTFSNHVTTGEAGVGRYGTCEWQMPGFDLATAPPVVMAIDSWPLSSNAIITRNRRLIRTNTNIVTVPLVSAADVLVGQNSISVGAGLAAAFPPAGYLVLGDGAPVGESIAYTSIIGGTTFSGCTPFIKAHLAGTNIKYGATLGEVVMMNATTAVEVQLPTAKRTAGEIVTIKEASGGLAGITVVPFTGETVDGAASAAVSAGVGYGVKSFVSNGSGGWLSI